MSKGQPSELTLEHFVAIRELAAQNRSFSPRMMIRCTHPDEPKRSRNFELQFSNLLAHATEIHLADAAENGRLCAAAGYSIDAVSFGGLLDIRPYGPTSVVGVNTVVPSRSDEIVWVNREGEFFLLSNVRVGLLTAFLKGYGMAL